METRFGVKDFFLFLIIGVLIVLVVLAMFQYDRQWELEQATSHQLSDLTSDVARIRTLLAQGVLRFNLRRPLPTNPPSVSSEFSNRKPSPIMPKGTIWCR